MTPGEVRRLYFIIRTFLSYGLDELIPKMRITPAATAMAILIILDAKSA